MPRFDLFVLGLAYFFVFSRHRHRLRNAGRERYEGFMDVAEQRGLSVSDDYRRMDYLREDRRPLGGMLALIGNLVTSSRVCSPCAS